VKSTQKQASCKNDAAHAIKNSMKKSCEIQVSGPEVAVCDGRIMAKFLMTIVQVNLVPIPGEATQICLNCCY